jgi:4-carboxymuconolactone decarboxylase
MTDQAATSRRDLGRRVFAEVNGFPPPDLAHPITEITVDHVFGEIWTRPGLTRKERRWISITSVAAAGATEALEYHLLSALGSGDITLEELHEAVAHFAVYQGFPKATTFHFAVERAAARLGEEAGAADEPG